MQHQDYKSNIHEFNIYISIFMDEFAERSWKEFMKIV
jgi:hypothetical protein